MTAKERIDALLVGRRPDRTPVVAWRHFYHMEYSPELFVSATVGFQRKFNWDFVKINPRASYHVEGWGAQYVPPKNPLDKPQRLSFPIGLPSDWEKIGELPLGSGVLAAELLTLSKISKKLGKSVYKFMTIFSPLSIAGDLVGTEAQLVRDMQESPLLVQEALEEITKTFVRFSVECLNAGMDGIFFATTEWASKNVLTEEDYRKFGRPYDLEVIETVRGVGGRVILHVCEPNNMLSLFADYPVDMVNWAASDRSNANLSEGYNLFKKPVIGGIDHTSSLMLGRKEALVGAVRPVLALLKSMPAVLGPECALPPAMPEENLMALRQLVE
ncbi:MAG TPA: uroporphyrinogen decarboxylase family protein, partial [candidate division Zixibacteria bacterium]|nr:uroporphyrinogen decarboxylase family protein [candidate division Zixibacteria bacterium]